RDRPTGGRGRPPPLGRWGHARHARGRLAHDHEGHARDHQGEAIGQDLARARCLAPSLTGHEVGAFERAELPSSSTREIVPFGNAVDHGVAYAERSPVGEENPLTLIEEARRLEKAYLREVLVILERASERTRRSGVKRNTSRRSRRSGVVGAAAPRLT